MKRLRTPRGVGALVAFVLCAIIGFLPLFAGPGYEQTVACGLFLPTITALVAAYEGFADRHAPSQPPLAIVRRGLETAALYCGIAVVVSFLHGLRVGLCDPLGGLATFALGAFSGTLLAGAVGAAFAIAAAHFLSPGRRRRRWAMIFAGLSPLATALVALAYFYLTPAVFAFDPFVGFFSGTLYDEVVDAYRPLLGYRAGTALTILAIATISAAFVRRDDGKLGIASRFLGTLGLAFALASATFAFYGTELGHRSTATSIRRALGGLKSGPRCDVVYPRATPENEANLLVRDCEEALASVEGRLGVQGPPRITAFFFKDSEQKRTLMGAADTYVAKPWRREVYLQVAPYPHPVLGHELAHVVAGNLARGPFHIAGGLGGILPNPGLVEGIAVYGSPDRDELTSAQWAAAMKRLNILPPLSRTFGGGFLTQNSSMAYTIAGSFVGWEYANGQGAAVRAWYGGARFESAFGKPFSAAESEFRTWLDTVPLPPEALAVAKGRFDRPAIWGRSCPHVVEKLRDEAEQCRDEGDLEKAEAHYRELLVLDEADPSARLDRAKLAAQRGDEGLMRALVESMLNDARVSTNWRNRAREYLADEDVRNGRLDAARALYDAARAEVLDEDWSRNLDVKSFLTKTKERAALFGRLLIGKARGKEGKDDALSATIAIVRFSTRSEASAEDLALARYLVGRRLVETHAYEEGEATLASIDEAALGRVSPRLVRESARLRIVVACMSDPALRKNKVEEALTRYRAAPPANAGRSEGVERLALRCLGPG